MKKVFIYSNLLLIFLVLSILPLRTAFGVNGLLKVSHFRS